MEPPTANDGGDGGNGGGGEGNVDGGELWEEVEEVEGNMEDGPQGDENDFQPGPSHAPPPPHLAPSSPHHQDHPHYHMGRSQGDDDTDEDNMGETTVRPTSPILTLLNVELHFFTCLLCGTKLLPLLMFSVSAHDKEILLRFEVKADKLKNIFSTDKKCNHASAMQTTVIFFLTEHTPERLHEAWQKVMGERSLLILTV